ncbi:hypothetical protein ACB092_06G023800, partial [Castanea dentata]
AISISLKPLHRTFHRLSQTYGQVYSLRFGSRLVVIVSYLSAVEECFTKNDMVLANRPRFLLGKHIGYNYTTMSSSSYRDHWRNLRRICTLEIFSTNRLNMFSGIRKDEVKHLLRKLSKSNNNSGGFAKVELKSMLLELTFNIITRIVAGKRYYGYGEDEKDEKEAKQMMRLAARTDVFLHGLIDEVRSKDKEGNTMINHLLSLQRSEPEYYTDQIIKGLTQVLIVAGTDTSAMTLEWAMSNMINLPHLSSNDCTIGGYDTPCDTMLLVNAWAIYRDPKLWDDATSFKPERFGMNESDLYKLMPFGLGRRACPGTGLARRTLGLTLGSMIQCFEWQRVTMEEVDMAEGNGVTMPKVKPLEAMCKARPIMHKVMTK